MNFNSRKSELSFPADKVDAIVCSDLEEPGTECEVRSILMKILKRFSECFDRQIIGIVAVVNHFKKHEVNWIFITLHQLRIRFLIALHGQLHKFVIDLCFFRKIGIYFHVFCFVKRLAVKKSGWRNELMISRIGKAHTISLSFSFPDTR